PRARETNAWSPRHNPSNCVLAFMSYPRGIEPIVASPSCPLASPDAPCWEPQVVSLVSPAAVSPPEDDGGNQPPRENADGQEVTTTSASRYQQNDRSQRRRVGGV